MKEPKRIRITRNNRIFLDDEKVEMHPLQRAIYILFLRHQEGIILKQLDAYYWELVEIYKHFRQGFEMERIVRTITRLCQPYTNSVQENVARANAQMIKLGCSEDYLITGVRGYPYKINIDRKLVSWE